MAETTNNNQGTGIVDIDAVVNMMDGGNANDPSPKGQNTASQDAKASDGELVVKFKEPAKGTPNQPIIPGGDGSPEQVISDIGKVTNPTPQKGFEDFLREKSGGKFSKWEDVEKEIGSNRVSFGNDLSKSIFENIQAGNYQEVADKLNDKLTFDKMSKMEDSEKVKTYLKMKHPGWDKEDVNDYFDSKFSVPEGADQSDARIIARNFKDELNEANKFLRSQKPVIDFTGISTSSVEDMNRQAAEQNAANAKIQELHQNYLQKLMQTESNFDGFKFNIEDDDMSVKTSFKLKDDEKKTYFKSLQNFDLDKWYEDNYIKDSAYNTDDFAKDMWMIKRDKDGVPNYEKVFASQMKQVLKEAKRSIVSSIKGGYSDTQHTNPRTEDLSNMEKDVDAYLEATN